MMARRMGEVGVSRWEIGDRAQMPGAAGLCILTVDLSFSLVPCLHETTRATGAARSGGGVARPEIENLRRQGGFLRCFGAIGARQIARPAPGERKVRAHRRR